MPPADQRGAWWVLRQRAPGGAGWQPGSPVAGVAEGRRHQCARPTTRLRHHPGQHCDTHSPIITTAPDPRTRADPAIRSGHRPASTSARDGSDRPISLVQQHSLDSAALSEICAERACSQAARVHPPIGADLRWVRLGGRPRFCACVMGVTATGAVSRGAATTCRIDSVYCRVGLVDKGAL